MPTQELSKLLYVEDDPDIREIALLALEHVGGFSVSVAESGVKALDLAPRVQPDLILLDMMMPGLDGLATLERLRSDPVTKAIPVIFMTAKVQDREVARYVEARALGVIAKPFDPMKLADQVRAIWHKAQRP